MTAEIRCWTAPGKGNSIPPQPPPHRGALRVEDVEVESEKEAIIEAGKLVARTPNADLGYYHCFDYKTLQTWSGFVKL